MATTVDYIEFVCDQINGFENIRYKKMFGEYMVYINNKPVLLVCDNAVYIKKFDELKELMSNAELGKPYDGAKEYYVLDIENVELVQSAIKISEQITPLPKPRKKSIK